VTMPLNWRRRFPNYTEEEVLAMRDKSMLETLQVTTSVPVGVALAATTRLKQLRAEAKT
jgi:hypothetical protein